MVRAGLFGDLLYGEGAYLHDLREELFSTKGEACGVEPSTRSGTATSTPPTALGRSRATWVSIAVIAAGHLDGDVLASPHASDCHRNMPAPRRRNHHEIEIITRYQTLIGVVIFGVKFWRTLTRLFDQPLGIFRLAGTMSKWRSLSR